MTPSARLAAAAVILDELDFDHLIERQLKAWARKNRYAGSGDRRAIADRVYTCVRRMRSSAAFGGEASGRALVLGSLALADGLDVDAISDLCTGGYGLSPLTEAERARLCAAPDFESEGARLDWPDWLMPEADAAFGAARAAELDALRQRASLDVRVNTLQASVTEAIDALDAEGIAAVRVAASKTALRLPVATQVFQTRAYLDGMIEPQDAASQAVAAFSQAKAGQTVLDFCAGAGGKTLALAAMMRNDGQVFAHDIDPRRMRPLPERAARCGATLIVEKILTDIAKHSCDAVLADAPCSGSGSWRRDPMGKWRLTPQRLAVLHQAQRDVLDEASAYIRSSGTLTYATCSVLPSENTGQVSAFLERHQNFTLEDTLNLWPARDGTDGFFAARLRKHAS